MTAFLKIMDIIKLSPEYGHAMKNSKNAENLKVAKKEIEKLLDGL